MQNLPQVKNIVASVLLIAVLPLLKPERYLSAATVNPPIKDSLLSQSAPNLIIITIDGFRWQEIFGGADPLLINNTEYTSDTATMKMLYWSESAKERRQKLMPFLWNILAKKGQLYGNRQEGNKVNTANIYNFSYPGYNEILTGNTDLLVASNKRKMNGNVNVLEYLNSKQEFKGKVVAFTSWDVFPFILNEERSRMLVNSGYENMGTDNSSGKQQLIDKVQTEAVYNKSGTRHDQLTFLAAKEYLQQHRPRVLFLGLGETDEYAHSRRYDLYLQQANSADRMLAELWHWIQTTPGYKDNTTILITTDHGRGSKNGKWGSHSTFIRGSSQTWLALLGPSIEPLGEIKEEQQIYQQQIAGMIADLVGEKFRGDIRDQNIVSSR